VHYFILKKIKKFVQFLVKNVQNFRFIRTCDKDALNFEFYINNYISTKLKQKKKWNFAIILKIYI
jgi:hypothetical protein